MGDDNSNQELASMLLIAHSGDARSLAFQALELAKEGNFTEAERCLKESDEKSKEAHKAQSEMLFAEANGHQHDFNLLLVHAQDHMMTSMLAVELIREIIQLRQENHKEN